MRLFFSSAIPQTFGQGGCCGNVELLLVEDTRKLRTHCLSGWDCRLTVLTVRPLREVPSAEEGPSPKVIPLKGHPRSRLLWGWVKACYDAARLLFCLSCFLPFPALYGPWEHVLITFLHKNFLSGSVSWIIWPTALVLWWNTAIFIYSSSLTKKASKAIFMNV